MGEIDPYDVWLFVGEKGEASYTDLIKEFVNSKKCSKQTLLNYKKTLEKEGKLKKRLSEKTGRPVYYVPLEFEKDIESLKIMRDFNRKLENMSPTEQGEYIRCLEKAVKLYRIEHLLKELSEAHAFPAKALCEKLLKMKVLKKDQIIETEKGHVDYMATLDAFGTGVNAFNAVGLFWEAVESENLEVKLVPSEIMDKYFNDDKPLTPHSCENILRRYLRIKDPYISAWRLVSCKPINGFYVFCAYKGHLKLIEEYFETLLSIWKDAFGFSKEDWRQFEPVIREMYEYGELHERIFDEICNYFEYKFKEEYKKVGYEEEEARKKAKEETKTLANKAWKILRFYGFFGDNDFWCVLKEEWDLLERDVKIKLFEYTSKK